MEADEFEIEKINFRPVSKGLGFHKSEKGIPLAQKTEKKRQNSIRHKLTSPLSSMDLETFYNPPSKSLKERQAQDSVKSSDNEVLEFKTAGLLKRFCAWIIDLLFIVTALASFIFLLMQMAQLDIEFVVTSLREGKFWEYYILFFIVFYTAYFTFFDLLSTPGKVLFKMKLVRLDHAPVSITESFVRSSIILFSSAILFLPLLMDIQGKLSETKLILRND